MLLIGVLPPPITTPVMIIFFLKPGFFGNTVFFHLGSGRHRSDSAVAASVAEWVQP
jgi:hypothetical protein